MDDPALDPAQHAHALRGLSRLNAMSGVAGQLYRVLKRKATHRERPLSIVDIATGSADIPVALLRMAAADGVRFDITACDISPVALELARKRATEAGVELRTTPFDVLEHELPHADVLMCSLFLHHLSDADVRSVLTKMAGAAHELVLISDLRRGPWGKALAASIPRLVTRSRVVHADAFRSAQAALNIGEARDLTRGIAAGQGWRVRPAFPARMLITWEQAPTTPS